MLCNACPRKCNVERPNGFCGCLNIHIAKVVYGFCYEEPCIGKNVAIFFAGCNLKCQFCQNKEISRKECGKSYSQSEFIELLKDIDEKAEYIDLVTPTQHAEQILAAFKVYKPRCKVIYNTSGYENSEMIEKLNQYVDIYLTDAKYFSNELSLKFSNAIDYFEHFSKSVKIMRKKQDKFENNLIVSGLIVRILVLPNYYKDSLRLLDYINNNLGNNTIISIMSQFTPNGEGEISRKLEPLEYKVVVSHALKLGFNNGYTQSLDSASSLYTPNFKA